MKKRKPHPTYSAVHSTWSAMLEAHDVGPHLVGRLLLEIAATARELVSGRGKKAKREAKHKLEALLDCHEHHRARKVA